MFEVERTKRVELSNTAQAVHKGFAKLTTTKRPPLPFGTHERRNQAQRDANRLIELCTSLNKAAKAIDMNKGRLSLIKRGEWTKVALNEIDLTMLAVGVALRENDIKLTSEARELAQQLQKQLSELHTTAAQLLRVLKKL